MYCYTSWRIACASHWKKALVCGKCVCVCFVIYPSARVHATPQYYSPYYKLTLCVNYARQSKGISPSLFPESICLQWIPLNFSKQCRSVEVGWGVSSVRHCSFHHNITHYTILWPIVYCRGHAIVRLAHTHTHAHRSTQYFCLDTINYDMRWISQWTQCEHIIGRNAITRNKCHFDYRVNESSKWTDTAFQYPHTLALCARVCDPKLIHNILPFAIAHTPLTNWIRTIFVWLNYGTSPHCRHPPTFLASN